MQRFRFGQLIALYPLVGKNALPKRTLFGVPRDDATKRRRW